MITIFRKFPNGSIIALFPTEPADQCREHCSSYQHTGQHGAASVDLSHVTTPAAPHEYEALLTELKSIGYDVEVRTRMCEGYNQQRYAKMVKP